MSSKIEWTDETWNPVTGCSKVSPGCENCYAERQALGRLKGTKGYPTGLPWTKQNAAANIVLHPLRLSQPVRWQRPRRIFVNSMSDLFHEEIPDVFISSVMAAIQMAPQHTFQVLTKRAERMCDYFNSCPFIVPENWPPRNLWVGVSVEDQKRADERIPLLLQIDAAVRWISAEPLLGPVRLKQDWVDYLQGWYTEQDSQGEAVQVQSRKIDWVVVGGESGPRARPMKPSWASQLRDECLRDGTPFFFKQWGEWAPCADAIDIVDGPDIRTDGPRWEKLPDDEPGAGMCRVGKKRAGRKLDGQLFDQYPEAQP